MPKAYLATVIAGGLTVYAAVLNSFNPTTLGVAGGILLATFPVFLLLTTTWRMPRRWEWAGWPAIASIVTLVAVVSTINTPLAVLIVAILGEEIAFAALASAVIIALFVLFVSCSTFAVKGVGRAQKYLRSDFYTIKLRVGDGEDPRNSLVDGARSLVSNRGHQIRLPFDSANLRRGYIQPRNGIID